jgi:hypothetical protein
MINHESIYALNPTVVTILGDIAYDAQDNVVEYNKEAVEAHAASKEYINKRAAEYPSFADQFDTIFHEGIDVWKAQIQAVKDKYPKGTE